MPDPAHDLHVGELVIVAHERRAFFRERELDLTAFEYDILSAMAAHPGWVYSAERLAEAVDPQGDASPFAVNVHISHLRGKLRDAGADDLIVTVRGAGWRLRRPLGDGSPAASAPTRPFVGRRAESDALRTVLETETGRFALVTGEPGIGKTTLIEHVLTAVAPRFEVVRAVCDGNGSGDHWLWRQLLGDLERRTGTRIVEEPAGHLLTRLLGRADEPDVASLAGADRRAAYEAATRYLQTVLPVHSRPIVFFIDDLHWADDASLTMLLHVLKRLATVPGCLVAACRAADARRRPALRPIVDFAAHRDRASLVSLAGLRAPEVAELVRVTLGTDDTDLVERLEEQTGGNPLFLHGYLRALGDTETHGPDHLAAPSISSLVQSELAWLPEETQRLLRFAAVAAMQFRPALVADAAGMPTDADGLDAAVDAGILVPVGRGMLGFRHALIRDALLEDVPAAELQAMHREVAEALKRTPSLEGRPVFRLAHHYARAGEAALPTAIGYLVAAARISTARFAFEDAITHLQEADDLLSAADLAPERARRVRAAILERLGGAHAALADFRTASAVYARAIDTRPTTDALARVRLHTKLGRTCINERRRAECTDAFATALAVLDTVTGRDTAWWRAWIEVRLDQAEASTITDVPLPFDLKAELEEPVLAHGTAAQRAKYFCHRATRLSIAARYGESTEALELQRRAVVEAEADGGVYLRAFMIGYLGSMLLLMGRPSAAEPPLRQSLGLTRYCADSMGETATLLFLAMAARMANDVRMTEVHTRELAESATRAPMPEFTSGVEANLGWVALRRGNAREATDRCERALEIWQRDPACSQSVWLMAWPAVSCALAADDVERAVEYAALMTRPDQQVLSGGLDVHLAEVIALHRRGEADAARDRLLALEAEAREYGYA